VREEFRANEGMDAIARRALPILKAALERQNCIVIDGPLQLERVQDA